MACLLKQLNPRVNSPGLYLLREKKDCSCHDLIESTLAPLNFTHVSGENLRHKKLVYFEEIQEDDDKPGRLTHPQI